MIIALIIKEIKLEVSKPNLIQAIVAKQNDCNSRFLKASLWDEGVQLSINPKAEVTINAERKDGASDSFFGEVNKDNTVTVPLHSWMLELEGTVNCDVSLLIDGRRLTTTTFVVLVEKAANGSDDIINNPQYNVLINLMGEVEGTKQMYANALKGSVSGNPVHIKDASPISHELKVKVTPKGSVTGYEENFVSYPHYNGIGEKKTNNGVTFVDNGDHTITANGKSTGETANYTIFNASLPTPMPAGNYLFFGCGKDGKEYSSDQPFAMRLTLYDEDGNSTLYISNRASRTVSFTVKKPIHRIVLSIRIYQNVSVVRQKFHSLLLNKDKSIVYAPSDDGTVQGILSENTAVLMADNGRTITAEYNKDTNKVIESLVNAILSLGGYV